MAKLTLEQLKTITFTVLGEAASEGVAGRTAVAHVIKNRAADKRWPSDPAKVAKQSNTKGLHAFATWNAAQFQGNSPTARYSVNDPIFLNTATIVTDVFEGRRADPTIGATSYYAPGAMSAPYWWAAEAKHGSVRIGNHLFAMGPPTSAPVPVTMSARTMVARQPKPPEQIAPVVVRDRARAVANETEVDRLAALANAGFLSTHTPQELKDLVAADLAAHPSQTPLEALFADAAKADPLSPPPQVPSSAGGLATLAEDTPKPSLHAQLSNTPSAEPNVSAPTPRDRPAARNVIRAEQLVEQDGSTYLTTPVILPHEILKQDVGATRALQQLGYKPYQPSAVYEKGHGFVQSDVPEFMTITKQVPVAMDTDLGKFPAASELRMDDVGVFPEFSEIAALKPPQVQYVTQTVRVENPAAAGSASRTAALAYQPTVNGRLPKRTSDGLTPSQQYEKAVVGGYESKSLGGGLVQSTNGYVYDMSDPKNPRKVGKA